jgi:hypothetical protein
MFGRRLESKSADGFLGNPAPEPQPVTFDQAMASKAQSESAARLQAAGANAAMGADAWNRLNDSQRLALRLSLALAERDPDLAATLRALAAESVKTGLSCPRCEWWGGTWHFLRDT